MKTKITFGVVVLVFSLFTSCNEKKENTENDHPKHDDITEAPSQIISIDLAKTEYDNYTKKRAELIEANEEALEDGSKFIASRYGDYDIETVKNYIKYVEQQADSAGVKIETLRFYFSTYPNKKDFPNHKKIKHPRQNSFFILPTMKVDSKNMGFYIKNLGAGKKEAALIRDYKYPSSIQEEDSEKSEASMFSGLNVFSKPLPPSVPESLIMNEGQMSPPPPHGSDFN